MEAPGLSQADLELPSPVLFWTDVLYVIVSRVSRQFLLLRWALYAQHKTSQESHNKNPKTPHWKTTLEEGEKITMRLCRE
jgi:hypothetical protein